jgi:hypothetical protein
MRIASRRFVIVQLVLAAGAAIAACSSHAQKIPPRPTHDLTAARHFRAFPIYYPGPSVDGLPLTDDGSSDSRTHKPGQSIVFVYGQCTVDPAAEEQDCAPPIEIYNNPTCTENPARYGPDSPHPVRTLRIRGVPAAVFLSGTSFDKLQLYSHLTTITIRANTFSIARRIALRLRGVNRPLAPSADLPRPFARELAGKVPCR